MSREETEQLDLSSGGLNIINTLRQPRTRFALAGSRLFRSRVAPTALSFVERFQNSKKRSIFVNSKKAPK